MYGCVGILHVVYVYVCIYIYIMSVCAYIRGFAYAYVTSRYSIRTYVNKALTLGGMLPQPT